MEVGPIAMEFWSKRTFKSIFLPGGAILLGAVLLLNSGWLPLPPAGVTFFYYAVFIAAVLLAWRFHSTRVLFSAIVLVLAHHAIDWYGHGRVASSGSGQVAFEAVALLVPLNFIFLTFFPERGSEGRPLFWFSALLFFESVFVAALARPDQPSAFLHFSVISSYHWRLPQPALLMVIAAVVLLMVRLAQFHKAIDNGMLWSLIAACLGLQAGGAGKIGTAYFGVAGFILASSIIENSYSLAYQDELTGLKSRRAFNDALLRLKPPYAIAAVDIDRFKSINDTYGHDTGDQVLRLVASKIARVSGGGQAFRVGGEEFTILFPGRTTLDIVDHLELLRMEIESSSFRLRTGQDRRKMRRETDRRSTGQRRKKSVSQPDSGLLSVTVSIGAAESHSKLNVDEVIQHADKALYRAKQNGRNRIEVTMVARRTKRETKSGKSAQF
jgi:diguanylate cyclase (GGDEF)-like protein